MKKLNLIPIYCSVAAVVFGYIALVLQSNNPTSNTIPAVSCILGVCIAGILSEHQNGRRAEVVIPLAMIILVIGGILLPCISFGIFEPTLQAQRRMWIEIGSFVFIPFFGICFDSGGKLVYS